MINNGQAAGCDDMAIVGQINDDPCYAMAKYLVKLLPAITQRYNKSCRERDWKTEGQLCMLDAIVCI